MSIVVSFRAVRSLPTLPQERAIDAGVRRLATVVAGLRDSNLGPENVGAAPEGAAPLLSR
jgi:hypothetical protein